MTCQRAEGAVHEAAVRYLNACVMRDSEYIAANSATDGSIRTTLLMRRIDGRWKVVHFHVSEGVDRTGIELES